MFLYRRYSNSTCVFFRHASLGHTTETCCLAYLVTNPFNSERDVNGRHYAKRKLLWAVVGHVEIFTSCGVTKVEHSSSSFIGLFADSWILICAAIMNRTATEMAATDSVNTGLTTFTAVLSLFGTLFIVVSFFVWKDIQSFSRRILVFISIADFFTAIANILGLWSHNEQVCLVQSTIGTLSVLSSFFWTVFMAVFLYVAVCKKMTLRKASNLMYLFHLLGWGIPIIIVAVGASTGKFGNNGDMVSSGWCWVNINMSWKDQVLWMVLAGKGWEIAAYFTIAFLYFLIKRHMKREVKTMGGWGAVMGCQRHLV